MKRFIAIFVLATSLSGCSFFQENPEAGRVLLRVAAQQYAFGSNTEISGGVCFRALRLQNAAVDARTILNDSLLASSALEDNIKQSLVDNGLNPLSAQSLIDVGKIYVRNKQQSLVDENPDIVVTVTSVVATVEEVATEILRECSE